MSNKPAAAAKPPRPNRKDLEFLAPSLRIIETPASPLRWIGGWFIVNSFLLALMWAAWGEVDIIASGQGRIVPQGHAQLAQAIEQGRVSRLNVREGDRVTKGDFLVELDETDVRADIERWEREVLASEQDIVRLELLTSRRDPAETRAETIKASLAEDLSVEARYRAERAEQEAKLASIVHQIEEQNLARRTAQAGLAQATEMLPLLLERVRALKDLSRRQMVPVTQMNDARQRALDARFQIASNRDKAEQAEANILRLERQAHQIKSEFDAKNLMQLSQAGSRLAEARQQLVKARVKLGGMRIAAPADGRVFNLAVNTVGAHVNPGQLLMSIIPDDEQLQVEATIAPKDIGFVEVGQPAEIKIDAFPFTRYGLIKGTVTRISHDATLGIDLSPTERQSGQAAQQSRESAMNGGRSFLVVVAIDPVEGQRNYAKLPILPGMSATVEITTGRRTLLDFVMSPLKEGLHGAARER